MRVLAISLIAFAILPISTYAQSTPPGAAAASPVEAVSVRTSTAHGPTIESAAAGFRLAPSTVADLNHSKVRRRSASHDAVVLIVVGVAAMAAGAFIGGTAGTVFLVGGAIIGLVGLYNLLE
jgi:hypothetical protein